MGINMSKKSYDDDDGRTVADMSGIERQPMIVPDLSRLKRDKGGDAENPDTEPKDVSLDKEQRRAFIGGAMTAAIAVGGIFVAAGALLIFLMTHILK